MVMVGVILVMPSTSHVRHVSTVPKAAILTIATRVKWGIIATGTTVADRPVAMTKEMDIPRVLSIVARAMIPATQPSTILATTNARSMMTGVNTTTISGITLIPK